MKKALLVIDYQNDFVDGTLGFAQAPALDGRIAEKIRQRREAGYDILFTFDTHTETYLSTQEGMRLPILHCVKDTPGWELYGETARQRQPDDRCFYKETFGSLALANYLESQGYTEVELVGLVSNICVLSNAVLAKAALPQARVVVDAACTASADAELHAKTLDVLRGVHVDVIDD